VFRVIPYWIGLIVIPAALLIMDRKALLMVDYGLLFTFVFFFIFSGNMARMEPVREFFSFLLEKKKGHNPNYTEEAVARLADYMKLLQKKQKKKELATEEARRAFVSSQDFKGMTEQDESVWKRIFKALEE
jgi:hypothetical protein